MIEKYFPARIGGLHVLPAVRKLKEEDREFEASLN
jgi:hypothetical protein